MQNADIVKDYDLSGQTALITGATGGIGADIACRLDAAGAKLILHTHASEEKAEGLCAELSDAVSIRADLGRVADVKAMMKKLVDRGDLPTLLINNAGIQTIAGVLDADNGVWEDINNVNLGGIYALTQGFSNALIEAKRGGSIVNIASIEGMDPAQDHAHYAASKAGVLMYTRACALELGPHNIRVNAVSPGLISRPDLASSWPEGVKRWQKKAPLSRLGEGSDVASAVHFLLSNAAKWISGTNLIVDGGMSAQNRW